MISCPCPCTLDVFTCRTSMPCGFSPRMHADVVALSNGGYSAPRFSRRSRRRTARRSRWRRTSRASTGSAGWRHLRRSGGGWLVAALDSPVGSSRGRVDGLRRRFRSRRRTTRWPGSRPLCAATIDDGAAHRCGARGRGAAVRAVPAVRRRRRRARPRPARAPAAAPESAIDALREIEFDRATGKLSDDDYAALKAQYTRTALVELRAQRSEAGAQWRGGESAVGVPNDGADAAARPGRGGRAAVSCGAALVRDVRAAAGAGSGVLLVVREIPQGSVRTLRRNDRPAGVAVLRELREFLGGLTERANGELGTGNGELRLLAAR